MLRRVAVFMFAALMLEGLLGFDAAQAVAQKKEASKQTAGKKPNVLFIMGDDIGIWNLSC